MAMIQLEAGLAPSNSPAARLFFLSSIDFLIVCKKITVHTNGDFLYEFDYFQSGASVRSLVHCSVMTNSLLTRFLMLSVQV